MSLTKFQINAVKSMARGLAPLQRKLNRIHEKEEAFAASIAEEKEFLLSEINRINDAIVTYTGGLTVQEVLNPESVVSENTPEGVVDETATVEMTEIPTPTEEIVEEDINEGNGEVAPEIEVPTAVIEDPAPEEVPFWDVKK